MPVFALSSRDLLSFRATAGRAMKTKTKSADSETAKLTHLDDTGAARMVDVGHKPVTAREALAEGFITVKPATIRAIADEQIPKGDVFAAARIAGILAAKKCGDLIPLCHPLPIESVEVSFDIPQLEPDH